MRVIVAHAYYKLRGGEYNSFELESSLQRKMDNEVLTCIKNDRSCSRPVFWSEDSFDYNLEFCNIPGIPPGYP